MAALPIVPTLLSKARMRLTNNRAGLMALCKNIREPIKACNFCFEIEFLGQNEISL
jgi:hypothetical protein